MVLVEEFEESHSQLNIVEICSLSMVLMGCSEMLGVGGVIYEGGREECSGAVGGHGGHGGRQGH